MASAGAFQFTCTIFYQRYENLAPLQFAVSARGERSKGVAYVGNPISVQLRFLPGPIA